MVKTHKEGAKLYFLEYLKMLQEKYDVMVFGMPQDFHYGVGMGTNPIQMMQALSAQVIRHKRVMKENCVIICSSFI